MEYYCGFKIYSRLIDVLKDKFIFAINYKNNKNEIVKRFIGIEYIDFYNKYIKLSNELKIFYEIVLEGK